MFESDWRELCTESVRFCTLLVALPIPRVNSFHEKAGECQDFSFIFSLFFSFCFIYFFFFPIIPIEPSRLCRHPSIRTLC